MKLFMKIEMQRLFEDDWKEFAQIRLNALQSDPGVFGSGFEKESQFTEADWRNRLKNNVIFLIKNDEKTIGLTGVSIDRNDETGKTAVLWGSWLAPEFRAKGIADTIYRTRIEWAQNQPNIERLVVAYRVSNLASKKAIQKNNFVETHREKFEWADGSIEDLVSCELKIEESSIKSST